MFGLEYIFALIKIFFNIGFAIITAIPARLAWNCIAANYFATYFPEHLAAKLIHVPYWHMVAFILVCTYIGEQIQKLTPKFVTVDQTNTNGGTR